MNSTTIMSSNQYKINNNPIVNKGFLILDELFETNNWHKVQNEINWICYTKFGHETEVFDIKIFKNEIRVSIPIHNSLYQYVSSFNSYYNASEYIETHLLNFINKKN